MGDSREAKLQAGDFDHIPIIDLSTLNSSHLDERKKLAQHIYHACTQVGFFYIIVMFLAVRVSTYIDTNIARIMGYQRIL